MDFKKVFLDTNIVLDILNSSRPNSKDAKLLWEILIINDCQIIISEDMLSTIFYINNNNEKTLEFFKIIQNRWLIVAFDKSVVQNAVDLSLEKNLDLEDLLQCLCAKENGCDLFITNDKKFWDCGLNIISSAEFLKRK